jgi:competence ComEA-like helix-hairpin-helix protein
LTHRNTTPVLVAGAYGQRLGVADIMFNKTEHRVYQVETRMLNVTPGPAGDSTVAARRVTELCRAGADTAVCVNMTECAPDSVGRLRLGALVAEAVRRKAQADIAVLPAYALESGLAAGPATRQDLFAVVPFKERLRFLIVDDTTMTRLVAPDSVNQHEPAPLLAGADYFVVGDTLSWPEISQVERVRVRDRKPGQYRVVTTEQWLERARAHVFGTLLPQTLTDLWISYAVAQETLKPVAGTRLYPATPGLVRQQTGGPVNINTADSQLLQTLPGIGPKTAERIIEYRETSGRFKSIEDIQNVKGIGPKKYEKIKALITVR